MAPPIVKIKKDDKVKIIDTINLNLLKSINVPTKFKSINAKVISANSNHALIIFDSDENGFPYSIPQKYLTKLLIN